MVETRTGSAPKTGAGVVGGAAVAFVVFLSLVSSNEGEVLTAYQDSGGVWTICRGHTEGVKPGMTATPEMCRALLDRDGRNAWDSADRLVAAEMSYGQWIAYADFIVNAGEGNFARSSMRRFADQGRLRESCDAFRRWTYVGKTDCRMPLSGCAGLVARREIERKYCLGELP